MSDFNGLTVENVLLERQIGAGGVAQVFYGRNYQTHAPMAVKIAQPRIATEPHYRQLFLQEALLNHSLVHPTILPVESFGEWQPAADAVALPYLISTYAPGGSMALYRERLALQNQPIPLHDAVKCIILVGEALHYAHSQGIIHLDIKPENLLLRRPSNLASVVIADFGASALLQGGTASQQVMGTPAYMSPEQLAGEPVSQLSDLYALAVVLYELIAGKRPFPGSTPRDIMTQHEKEPDWTAVPSDLQPILLKALRFAQNDQYSDVAEFVSELREWQHSALSQHAAIPHSVDPAETRFLPEEWLPPVHQMRAIDYDQRWTGSAYRFFIAHQNGLIDTVAVSGQTRIVEIRRGDLRQSEITDPIGVLSLPDAHISATPQIVLERAGQGWQVLDKGSTNGSFIENERIEVNRPTYWQGRTPLRVSTFLLVWEGYELRHLSPEQAQYAYVRQEEQWRRLMGLPHRWKASEAERPLSLMLPTKTVHIKPGEIAELAVTLATTSPILRRFEVRIDGIPTSWYTIDEAVGFSPVVEHDEVALIQLHPPLNASAGNHDASIIAFLPESFLEQARQQVVIFIEPVANELIDLHPKHLRGGGVATVSLWNTGNQDASFWVLSRDPADELDFAPAQEQLVVQPGERYNHAIAVTPTARRPLLPPAKQLPYEVRVGRADQELKTLNGHVQLAPYLPFWLLILIPLLILLLIFIVPRIVSRQKAKDEMRQNAAALATEARETAVAATATLVIGEQLVGAYEPAPGETPPPGIATAQADMAVAAANAAGAAAQATAAADIAQQADDIGLLGPAIPPPQPPTSIMLDNTTLPENAPSGTVVGILSSQDGDEGDSHIYTLVAGDGDTHNGLFSIAGSQLLLLGSLDYEGEPDLSLRVQSMDNRGQTFDQRLQVEVTDVNEAFTGIELDNLTVEENKQSANVGELTAVGDPDKSDMHTFELASDPSEKLEINGSSLRVKQSETLNAEAWPDGLEVEVLATDGGGNQVMETFTLQVEDANDPPVVTDFGIALNEDSELAIDRFLFLQNFSDEDVEDRLTAIKITLLPAVGQLRLGEAFVFEGQEITVAQLASLNYIPARNFNGRLSFQWLGSDGTAYSQQPATTTITVIPQVDPPTFVPDSTQVSVDEDSGMQNINWATSIRYDDGDINDLRFVICGNNNSNLFSAGPRVSNGGNLIFTPKENQNGSAKLDVLLTETPRPTNGDESTTCAGQIKIPITVTIQPINDAPIISGISLSPISYPSASEYSPFTNLALSDADDLQNSSFTYETGFIELSLYDAGNENLKIGGDFTVDGSNNLKLNGQKIGEVIGNQSTFLRVTNLTTSATLDVVEQLLQSIVVTLDSNRSMTLILTLNDGGNIDKNRLPQTVTFTVKFTN